MDWFMTILLAFLQGVTEFLPVSSSAHLVLLPQLFGTLDQGLGFDLAIHGGSLVAVIFHFRQRLRTLLGALVTRLRGGAAGAEGDLALKLLLASLPLFVAAPLLARLVAADFRSGFLIGGTTLIFGVLLWLADRRSGNHNEYGLTWMGALLIGLAQILAIVPGVSRAGVTITAGRWLGLQRQAASNFSFLLAIPTLGGVSLALLIQHLQGGQLIVDPTAALFGFTIAAFFSLFTIRLFLHFVERIGLLPFVLYRLLLGGFLLAFFISSGA